MKQRRANNNMYHLFNLGIIRFKYPEIEGGKLKTNANELTLTSFGKVVAKKVVDKYGLECDL